MKGIGSLLSGHRELVKAVCFLPEVSCDVSSSFLVTGGDDFCLKLWSIDDGLEAQGHCLQTLQAHEGPINCIGTAHGPQGTTPKRVVFASGAADATIKIWSLEGRTMIRLQTVETQPKFFPLSLALRSLDDDGTSFVLAAAGTRDTIQIYTSVDGPEGLEFTLQATLQGHEGWIRSLDFTSDGNDILLASASQDKYIRIWRVHRGKELPAQRPTGGDNSMGTFLSGNSPSNKAHWIKAGASDFSITFEALLFGHDDWIYSAKWHAGDDGKLQLLSTSADNSLAIWEADASSGIWLTSVRLGELSKEKGATTATGSIGGFWTGLWSPSGTSVVTVGRTGSWRRWNYDAPSDRWIQGIAVSGHTKAVTGITWSHGGAYLLSTSSDQTTRLHAEWLTPSCADDGTWHEMARPQIHGYDLNCIAALGASRFVSGADEKLMRVFTEPRAVAEMLARLTGRREPEAQLEAMPDAANMPVLGLSNKAIDAGAAVDEEAGVEPLRGEGDGEAPDPGSAAHQSALGFEHPPYEESLSRYTLWPEVEKLYGHGYEISCLAVSHGGDLVASACKASSRNHAVIRLFETERWVEVRPPLTAHSLTVTRLRFAADDKYLLSVGRDREWAVFERQGARGSEYALLQSNPKGHTRMILDCAWAPLGERRVFATAGRDKNVKIWAETKDDEGKSAFELAATLPRDHAVTAVDFLWRQSKDGGLVLAVGTEGGTLSIVTLRTEDLAVSSKVELGPE